MAEVRRLAADGVHFLPIVRLSEVLEQPWMPVAPVTSAVHGFSARAAICSNVWGAIEIEVPEVQSNHRCMQLRQSGNEGIAHGIAEDHLAWRWSKRPNFGM